MKKWISVLIIFALAFSLFACSASEELSVPDDRVYKQDVQEYIEEILDSSATIRSFEKTGSTQTDNTLTVTCVALYSGENGESKGTFSLTYSKNGNEWSLDKCRVELEESTAQTEPDKTVDASTDEPTQDTNHIEPSEPSEPAAPAVSALPESYAYSLTQVGTIQDSERSLEIQYDAVLQIDGNTGKLLNYLGESKNDVVISDGTYLGEGVYSVRDSSGEINSVGLISQEGEVLIPCEACKIDWPKSSISKTNRYLKVIYTTGETTDIDECFIYTTDSGWGLTGPQEGDTMYKGYALVYDLEAKAFVPNVKITNSDSLAMQPCGRSFTVEDESGITTLYNSEGKALFQTAHIVFVGGGTLIVSDDGTYRVYDENGNQTYTSNKSLYLIDGNGGYISKYENDRYVIMDRNGNQVAGAVFESVYSEENDVFRVKNNGKFGLVHADGTVLLSCDKFDNVTYIDYGLYCSSTDTDNGYTYSLIGSHGIIKEGLPSCADNLKIMNGETAFVINDGDYTLSLEEEYPTVLVPALIAAKSDANGLYAAFDLFTGEQLLGYEYEVIKAAAGYLYAYKNGEWTVYRIEGPVV